MVWVLSEQNPGADCSPAGRQVTHLSLVRAAPEQLRAGPISGAGAEMGVGQPQDRRVVHQLWLVWS